MRRILLLVTDLEIGGTPTVVREVALRLARGGGVHVEVACLGGWGPVAEQISEGGVEVRALGARCAADLRAVPRFVRLVGERGIDTVLSFLVHANAVAAVGAMLAGGVRLFQSIQTTQARPGWHWGVQRMVHAAAERIIVPTESVARVAEERSGIGRGRIVVIPNGVEVGEFEGVGEGKRKKERGKRGGPLLGAQSHSPCALAGAPGRGEERDKLKLELRTPEHGQATAGEQHSKTGPLAMSLAHATRGGGQECPRQTGMSAPPQSPSPCPLPGVPGRGEEGDGAAPIGFVGRLDPVKRVPDLLGAVKLLAGRVCLHVFGEGGERGRIEEEVARLGIARWVTMHGAVGRPQEALGEIEVLALPSEAEGFGLVLIEAMAAGVPVVATDAPGIRDVVKDGQTGLLVPVGDVRALAAAIGRVIDDAGLRSGLIEQARRDVRERFSWDRVIERYRAVLGL